MRHHDLHILVSRKHEYGSLDPRAHDALSLAPDQLYVPYRLEKITDGQPLYRNRWQVVPDLDLSEYRYDARFDWIEIKVETGKKVWPGEVGSAIKKALNDKTRGGAWATCGLNRNSRETTELIICLQDPTQARFETIFRVLREECGVKGDETHTEHQIWAWELAVDVMPLAKFKDPEERMLRRARMSEVLRKHVAPLDDYWLGEFTDKWDWLRAVDAPEKWIHQFATDLRARTDIPDGLSDLLGTAADPACHQTAPLDGTVYIGARYREAKLRLQDKIEDKRKSRNKAKRLDLRDRRSRIEITLGCHRDYPRDERPDTAINNLYQIQSFCFDALRRGLFDFELPTIASNSNGEPDQVEWDIFCKTGAFGLKLYTHAEREIARIEGQRDYRGRLLEPLGLKGRNKGMEPLNDRVRNGLMKVGKNFVRR